MNSLARYTSIATLALAPFITSCATKKYVKTTVAPIDQRVGELDTTTKAQAKSIEEAERGILRADERAQGAEGKADAAGKEAATARTEAAEGKTLAQQGLTRADQLGKDMTAMNSTINSRFENIQNYKLVNTEQVLFKSGVSELNDEAKASLDASVTKVSGMKNFVIELQGFTDSTGSKSANLDLSKRRAEAVVRYLTTKHSLALHRIFVAGYGEEFESADNKTRDARKLNRRVEMKVYVPADQAKAEISNLGAPSN